ncbi:hypothetical protein VNO78_33719 [Psophocarpus tetragonolobus]|uniref:Uncharacterized protein n=1 Tax=Psophocarpus tetragonolobus TaxID=3891 RepID=A0AAN9P2X2_PSOTE
MDLERTETRKYRYLNFLHANNHVILPFSYELIKHILQLNNLKKDEPQDRKPDELAESLCDPFSSISTMIKSELRLDLRFSCNNLGFLSYLNLSLNNLSGKLPVGSSIETFDNSSFVGNIGLCGLPLTNKCKALFGTVMCYNVLVNMKAETLEPFDTISRAILFDVKDFDV